MMASPGRQQLISAAVVDAVDSFCAAQSHKPALQPQIRRFPHLINADMVFGTHSPLSYLSTTRPNQHHYDLAVYLRQNAPIRAT